MSHSSDRLRDLIAAERAHLEVGSPAVQANLQKLTASVAAHVAPPFELPLSAVPSTLGAFSLAAVGASVGTAAVLIAAGTYWALSAGPTPIPTAPTPPPPPPPAVAQTASTATAAPTSPPPPRPAKAKAKAPRTLAPSPAPPPPPPPPPPEASPSRLSEELRLLRRAQSALKGGRLEEALQALEAHAREFPQGRVQEEREALRAITLCGLRRPEGREAARAFLAAYPNSPQAGRVRADCLDE